VQSYAGLLEFGLTACRRVLSQDESHEIVRYLQGALRDIEALPPVDAVTPSASASPQSAGARSEASPPPA
jgi:diacylglycerol O-acyltransferase / wax synthase